MYKHYKGKVVHIFGVLSSYLGRLDTAEHPNGKGWMRILKPCAMNNEGHVVKVIKLGGYEGLYKDYVDMKIPDDMCIEIREVAEDGPLFAAYQKELKRKKSELILTPNDPRLGKVKSIATH